MKVDPHSPSRVETRSQALLRKTSRGAVEKKSAAPEKKSAAGAEIPPAFALIDNVKNQRTYDGRVFPLVLAPARGGGIRTMDEAVQHIAENRKALLSLNARHGAILFRGFPAKSPEDFGRLVTALGHENFAYVGGAAPRNAVAAHVFTSNESPSENKIPPHHELSHNPQTPEMISFFCFEPPLSRGETPILRSDELYARVEAEHPEYIAALREKGLRYTRVAPPKTDKTSPIGRSWPDTFGTENPKEAEAAQTALGGHIEWLPNGDAKLVSAVLPGVGHDWVQARAMDPGGDAKGPPTFFNSTIAISSGWKDSRNDPAKAVTFGDGSPLPKAAVERSHELALSISVAVPWRRGDFMLINNQGVMHARRHFRGEGHRKIYAALLAGARPE